MTLDDTQKQAVDAALNNRDYVITGGAGTGKTTIIQEIMERDGKCELLAPTGKAAARVRELTGYEASTIHRWLRWDGAKIFRKSHSGLRLIIDEASMIDSWLLAMVLKFDPPGVILVGDSAQLPPVGKGAPFHDIITYRKMVATLETCHRAKEALHVAANLIRIGRMPEQSIRTDDELFSIRQSGGTKETEDAIIDQVKKGYFDPRTDIVITCRNGESDQDWSTCRTLNNAIVDIVNPRDYDGQKWKVGDRVMNLENDNDLEWYNGDCGTITEIDTDGDIWVQPDRGGETLQLNKEARRKLTLAYAVTVHKSQGSQYRSVFFLCVKSHSHMLNRNLIYTAVTRATKSCEVFGNIDVFSKGLSRTAHKNTVFQLIAKKHQN